MDSNDLNFKALLGLAHQTTQSSKKNFSYANLKVRERNFTMRCCKVERKLATFF